MPPGAIPPGVVAPNAYSAMGAAGMNGIESPPVMTLMAQHHLDRVSARYLLAAKVEIMNASANSVHHVAPFPEEAFHHWGIVRGQLG